MTALEQFKVGEEGYVGRCYGADAGSDFGQGEGKEGLATEVFKGLRQLPTTAATSAVIDQVELSRRPVDPHHNLEEKTIEWVFS